MQGDTYDDAAALASAHAAASGAVLVPAFDHPYTVAGQGTVMAEAVGQLPGGRRRTRAVLRMLGDHFSSPVFAAALELWVAARTDDTLLAAVSPLEQRVGREAHRLTVAALGADESRPGVRELVQATLDLVRGLGLAQTITDDTARRRRILDAWADVLDRELAKEPAR